MVINISIIKINKQSSRYHYFNYKQSSNWFPALNNRNFIYCYLISNKRSSSYHYFNYKQSSIYHYFNYKKSSKWFLANLIIETLFIII